MTGFAGALSHTTCFIPTERAVGGDSSSSSASGGDKLSVPIQLIKLVSPHSTPPLLLSEPESESNGCLN